MLNMSRPIAPPVSCNPFHVKLVCARVCMCCKTRIVIHCFHLSCRIKSAILDIVWFSKKNNKINQCLLLQCINRKLKQFKQKERKKRLREKSYRIYATYPWVMLVSCVKILIRLISIIIDNTTLRTMTKKQQLKNVAQQTDNKYEKNLSHYC